MKKLDGLTVDDVDQLEPGVETDWLIAQLMPRSEDYALAQEYYDQPIDYVEHLLTSEGFSPSQDANDAERVLEAWGIGADVAINNRDSEEGEWIACFGIIACARDKSFCMAVCRARLRVHLTG